MGLYVETPDGLGEVLGTQSVHGRTSYLVKGAGFEGWYDGLQVTSDWADQPDDVIPNEDNETVLPYPSEPQGPGWDGTNSTIQPNIDPHLDISGASDSLTGEPTSEDPVEADIEGLFEPSSHLAGVRPRRLHFATHDDPILDVTSIPESSPTGLENSPLNPDSVDTDDLFDGNLPHFERESAAIFDSLVIKDEFSFMRYAADTDGDGDDDKKKHHHENKAGYPVPKDNDDDGDDDSDSSDDSSSDDGGSDGGGGGDSAGGDSSGGGHTAAFALRTTADLHFLANFCNCVSALPLHSKSEHRELVIEASAEEVTPQELDLEKLLERYEQTNFHWQESNLRNLVDHSLDDGDSADLYNKLAFVKHAEDSGYEKYIGSNGDGTYHLIASGGGKLPKGQQYGHYDSHEDALHAVEAIIARNHSKSSKTAAPAADPNAQPTQIESQIEQLMQFWAVDNNGWWHWTGSQADLALLNQMQQQMMAVGMPGGPPGQMQTQGSVHTANPALLAPLLEGEVAGGAAAGEGGVASQFGNLMGAGGGMSPAGPMMGVADAISQFNGGRDVGVAHHGVPFQSYSFVIEENTPPAWREYLRVVASDKMVALAAWKDVVQKSKRLRSEGAIDLEVFKPDVITAYVQGDNGRYYTTVQRLGSVAPGVGRQLTSTQVSGWSCECEWGHWAWLRKRSFVGRMCSHAYALFSEMRSLDWKARRGEGNGQPIKSFSATNKTSWTRSSEGYEWVSDDPTMPTAAIGKTASGYEAQVWSDGTAEDCLSVGVFSHSEKARRVAAQVITAHVKLAEEGDVDVVGGTFEPYKAPDSISGGGDYDPYSADGDPESLVPEERQEGSAGIEEGNTRTGAAATGDDDEGPEETDDGIEEEEPDDEDSLDEEVAEDEGDSGDEDEDDEGEEPEESDDEDDDEDEGTDNPGDESDDEGIEKQSDVHPPDLTEEDGPHHDNEVPCDNCSHVGGEHDVEEPHGKCLHPGCNCPGWDDSGHPDTDSGDMGKESSVAALQERFGLSHLAGANYSLAQQNALVQEGEGKTARNHGDLNVTGTHYEAKEADTDSPEDTLAFLF